MRIMRSTPSRLLITLLSTSILASILLSACGGTGGSTSSGSKTVTLVTNDSFAISKSAQRSFERSSGLRLRILRGGDAGATLNQSILTKDRPLGDVFFGVDNTLLTRALRAGIFTPYKPAAIDQIDPRLTLDDKGRVTTVDVGDVCVNYDRIWFTSRGLTAPKSLRDLARPESARLLVVENPATSSTGLAFMLATIAEFGERGWRDYWSELRDGGVEVVAGWEQAYNSSFSGSAGKGERPLVVSYATSPPAEVIYADPRPSTAPTGVLTKTCFRQIEGVGAVSYTHLTLPTSP
jgi:thiamine transport system substrate-binding protein